MESTRVNCKVSAVVNYPDISEGHAIPTVDCTTTCTLKGKEKKQSYFIGYVYRHFERLEKEYGLMLQIRYSKGGDKSCVLVPAAENEEVLSTHLEGNTACAQTTSPSTTVPITYNSTPTTVPTTLPPTTFTTTVPVSCDSTPTTLPTTVPPPTTISQTTDPSTVPSNTEPYYTITGEFTMSTIGTGTDNDVWTTSTSYESSSLGTNDDIWSTSTPQVSTSYGTDNDVWTTSTSYESSSLGTNDDIWSTSTPQVSTSYGTDSDIWSTSTTTTMTSKTTTTTLWACGSDWTLIGTTCFHISGVRGDWHKGQDYCIDLGATLASVRSQEEQDVLNGLVDDNAWIGLHDMHSEGEHLWEDQTTLSYSNWEPGQPDNSGQFLWWGGEDCVEMKMAYNLRWNDQDCSNENIFICRKDAFLQ